MEWEQTSEVLVAIGTLIILAFSVFIVMFMVNLKRRLNAKQHLIDKLKNRIKELEDEVSELKGNDQ